MSVSCDSRVLSGGVLCCCLTTLPAHSYRGRCEWAWSWILDSEEAVAHWGLLREGEIRIFCAIEWRGKWNIYWWMTHRIALVFNFCWTWRHYVTTVTVTREINWRDWYRAGHKLIVFRESFLQRLIFPWSLAIGCRSKTAVSAGFPD